MSSLPELAPDPSQLAQRIRALSRELGFQRCGIAGIELAEDEAHLRDWLAKGLYGSMDWMARHGDLRSRPTNSFPVRYGSSRSGWTTVATTVRKPGLRCRTGNVRMWPATRWAVTITS